MKKVLLFFIFGLCLIIGYPQEHFEINFDDTSGMTHLIIDTISNPENIWQIGAPQKVTLNMPISPPNVIITDTINPYPVNNISSFIIWQPITFWTWDWLYIIFSYSINSDTISDYWKIEFSADNGTSWIDMSNDTTGCIRSLAGTVFSGNSNGWRDCYSDIYWYELGLEEGDTALYRFTFLSDGINNNKDGVMFDSFAFGSCIIGFPESLIIIPSSCFPNPASDHLTIKLGEPVTSGKIEIFSSLGVFVQAISVNGSNSVSTDISSFPPGVYFYKYINSSGMAASGKFVKQK
ncbi:MAG: T9SS type A sorting domain-containing protein [Bacteroidetes bacterium]|nr:T9SS type A sorting domain-containing protein [Bacteroidota bacterium]